MVHLLEFPMRVGKGVILFFLFMGMSASPVFAALLPDTAIRHEATGYFEAGTRPLLDARISDTKGITAARCYFKAGSDIHYLFVSMDHLAENRFQCTLPAFRQGSQSLEYFFLIVNGDRQVVRSGSYIAREAVGDEEAVADQAAADPSSFLLVQSELGPIEREGTAILDDRAVLAAVEDVNQLYGLRAGVHEPGMIPDAFNAMPGYFGGFVLDRLDGTIRPVKGFVPNIHPSLSRQAFPMDGYREGFDVQAESGNPPDIGGEDWSGYFTRTDSDVRKYLTATIVLSGRDVTITTTLIGLGHFLSGIINESGYMLLYDEYDGEDWTTHDGPATTTEVNIYDYLWKPEQGEPEPPLNAIILYRPPLPPSAVRVSEDVSAEGITVSWDPAEGADHYQVFECGSVATDSCIALAEVISTEYFDTRTVAGNLLFRIKACNEYGCGEYSDYGSGYRIVSIAPVLKLLLKSGF
jgi:hypothetical protein